MNQAWWEWAEAALRDPPISRREQAEEQGYNPSDREGDE